MERVHDNYGMQGRTAFHYIVQNLYAFAIDSDDSWARDIGPTFVRNEEGELRGIDWQFNAWGGIYNGLYAEWQADNAFAREVANTQMFMTSVILCWKADPFMWTAKVLAW